MLYDQLSNAHHVRLGEFVLGFSKSIEPTTATLLRKFSLTTL